MTNSLVQQTGQVVSDHLAKIAMLFKNPRITIVIRSPDLSDGDMILTDDDLGAAITAIERLKSKDSPSPSSET